VILGVLVDAVIEGLYLLLLKKTKNLLLELAGALAWDDLHLRGLLLDGLLDDPVQRPVDLAALVVDVVEIQLQLHKSESRTPAATAGRPQIHDKSLQQTI
jgi:hypothetical protein